MEEFRKSAVNIWRSYMQEYSVLIFIDSQCILISVAVAYGSISAAVPITAYQLSTGQTDRQTHRQTDTVEADSVNKLRTV